MVRPHFENIPRGVVWLHSLGIRDLIRRSKVLHEKLFLASTLPGVFLPLHLYISPFPSPAMARALLKTHYFLRFIKDSICRSWSILKAPTYVLHFFSADERLPELCTGNLVGRKNFTSLYRTLISKSLNH